MNARASPTPCIVMHHLDGSLGAVLRPADDIATGTVDRWQCMQSLLHAHRVSTKNEKNVCQCRNVQGFKHMTRASPSPAFGKRVRRQQNRPRGSTNELGHNHTAEVVAAFHGLPKFWLSIARCSHRPGMLDSAAQERTLVLLLRPPTRPTSRPCTALNPQNTNCSLRIIDYLMKQCNWLVSWCFAAS